MEMAEERQHTCEPSPEQTIQVLIVDDSKGLNRLIQKALEREGFLVKQAFDGAGALALACQNPDSIMLLDYVLPDMTAPEVIEHLRSQSCDIPFIMMTGQGDERVAVDMMKLGARDYITKQGNFLESLPRILQRSVDELKQQQRVFQAERLQRESERRFREVLENVRMIAFMLDRDGTITFCNDRLLEVTGWTREDALGSHWFEQFPSPEVRDRKRDMFAQAMRSGDLTGYDEYEILSKHGERRVIAWNRILLRDAEGNVIGENSLGEDITERRQGEQRQRVTAEILSLLNSVEEQTGIIQKILLLLKEFSGMDAVGIRLQDGEDFPYYETNGLSEDFLCREDSLCLYDEHGELLRDDTGRARLDCLCGMVISGAPDPSRSFFTESGSFWINDPQEFLRNMPPEDRRVCTRCHCVHTGYQSIALVPLRSGASVIGLLQLNDTHKNMFTLQRIKFLEEIGASIGIAITRKRTEETLRHLQKAVETMHLGVTITDLNRKIIYVNPADASMHGYMEEELMGRTASLFAPLELQQPLNLEVVEKSRNWIRESINIRKDGTHFPVQLSSDIVKDADGRPTAIVTTCEDITTRKQAEEIITQERNLLRTLIDNLPEHIFVKDEKGRFLISNIAHARFLDALSPEELIGSTVFDCLPEEQALLDNTTDQAVIRSGQPIFNQEGSFILPDGTSSWRILTKLPLLDNNRAIIGLIGISHDITEQKQVQNALESQTKELEERVKELNCLFQISHLTEDETLSLEAILDQTVNLLPPAWKYPDITCARICLENRQFVTQNFVESAWSLESRIVSDSLPLGVVQVYYTEERPDEDEGPFLWEERSLLNMVAERLGQLIEKKRIEEAIRESRKFLQSTLDSLAAHIAILDEHGKILEVNASWKHFADINDLRREGYYIGQNYLAICDTATGEFSKGGSEAAGGIRAVIAQEQERFYQEYPCHSPTTQRWFAMRVTRFQSPGAIRIVIAHENITERKHAEEALQQTLDELESRVQERTAELIRLNKELEQASRLKDEFLANMSHELRTPLNAILGYAQILRGAENFTEQQREALTTVKNSGEHLLSMINEILDLSKIEAGQMTLQPTDIHLPYFLKNLTDMIQVRAYQKGITFQYETDPDLPDGIRIDQKRLREILLNVLGNAVKFTDQGSVTFRVTNLGHPGIKHQGPSSEFVTVYLRFDIEDTGPGIDPEHLPEVFLPFHQIDGQQQAVEGTGLGLTISRKLVSIMGGELQVVSAPGKGTHFWFTLEVEESESTVLEHNPEFPNIAGYTGRPKTILIIDDVAANREVLKSMLTPLSFQIFEAVNGEEGLEQAERHSPDMILLDLFMPGINGFNVARRIRRMEQERQPRIIAISAGAFDETRQQSLSAGCDDFLAKPFQIEALLTLLKRHLAIDWLYEEHVHTQKAGMEPREIPQDLWQQLAEDDFQGLRDKAIRGSVKEILRQLEAIERQDPDLRPLTQALRRMAKRFDVDLIVECLQQGQQAKEDAHERA